MKIVDLSSQGQTSFDKATTAVSKGNGFLRESKRFETGRLNTCTTVVSKGNGFLSDIIKYYIKKFVNNS